MIYRLSDNIPQLEEGREGIPCGTEVETLTGHFKLWFDLRQQDGHLVWAPKNREARLVQQQGERPGTTIWVFIGFSPHGRLPIFIDDKGDGRFEADVFWDP